MKKIDFAELFDSLTTPEAATNEFNAVISNFVAQVQDYGRNEHDLPERIRTLRFARAELLSAQTGLSAGGKRNELILAIFKIIVEMIDCELNLTQLELKHPERFVSRPTSNLVQHAQWSGTNAQLLEIVIALSTSGLIRTYDGRPMCLSEVAGLFEMMFGLKFKDLYGRKTRLLMRKKGESPFLESLLSLYRKEVEKMKM
jgi:hypothetical protein